MISEEEYNKALSIVEKYHEEQMELERSKLRECGTTIPNEQWGVHRTHCCYKHGCKYGDKDCPVELGLLKQDYPCESCNEF